MGIFNHIQTRKPKLNKFDLSHERKMSMKMGKLYPMLLQEIVPGDKFKVNSEILMRLAPMISPVMHRVNVYTHYFFVPNRLVWNEWEDFITGGEDGTSAPVFPQLQINSETHPNFKKGSLSDYFGITPTAQASFAGTHTISALPFRAYQEIYNEYFRDQNLETKVTVPKTSGIDSVPTSVAAVTTLRDRAWEKDYFTSALPWSQRGGEAQIPLGEVTPVYKTKSLVVNSDIGITASGNLSYEADGTVITDAGQTNQIQNLDKMSVDATTINDLRKANRLQQWLEKSARGGSRYIEQIFSHFGVKSSDARLQRPEYLGGGKQPIVISEVLQTSNTDTTEGNESAQGNMAGHGISVGRSNSFKKSFEEHGFIIGIVSVIPKTAYQQGVERQWSKFDKFDYYWPEFAHLGEQEIKQEEIWQPWNTAGMREKVFGYQQRYAEYKYNQSSVHGDFRDTLQFWHMGQWYENEPALNKEFVMSNPTKRIFAVKDQEVDELFVQIYNKVDALRPMPYFSIPSL